MMALDRGPKQANQRGLNFQKISRAKLLLSLRYCSYCRYRTATSAATTVLSYRDCTRFIFNLNAMIHEFKETIKFESDSPGLRTAVLVRHDTTTESS
eukprot:g7935.t1